MNAGRVHYVHSTDSMTFGTANGDRMTIKSNGDVGIGTGANVADARLSVKSSGDDTTVINAKSDGDNLIWRVKEDADGDGEMQLLDSGGNLKWLLNADGDSYIASGTGNVIIGGTSPSYKLEVTGTFYSSGSSIEYKQDVEPYTPPEGALMSLKPVQYQYKDAWKDFGKRYAGNSSKQLGFVAEDVAKILPELAVTKSEDGKEVVRNVDYEKLTVLLVSEVQSLRKEVNDLRRSR